MRIVIITLPLHINYGGILQAYALQKVLRDMGHDVITIDRDYHLSAKIWKLPFAIPYRVFKKYILRKANTCVLYEYYQYKENQIQDMLRENTNAFINKYIKRRLYKQSISSIVRRDDYDAFIVGSDQIWRPKYIKSVLKSIVGEAFLDFTKSWNVRRIAYAASFGTDEWEYSEEETHICKTAACLFDSISIREESGIQLCKKYLGVDAQLVLDPTMLVDAEDYKSLFAGIPQTKGNYIVSYILDDSPSKKKILANIAKEKGLKIVNISICREAGDGILPSVESWLQAIYNASFVVTDSFHACVFSILFNKQFVVIGNEQRGLSRFKSLLHIFNIEGALISNMQYIPRINHINYEDVNKILYTEKRKSLNFLSQVLQ